MRYEVLISKPMQLPKRLAFDKQPRRRPVLVKSSVIYDHLFDFQYRVEFHLEDNVVDYIIGVQQVLQNYDQFPTTIGQKVNIVVSHDVVVTIVAVEQSILITEFSVLDIKYKIEKVIDQSYDVTIDNRTHHHQTADDVIRMLANAARRETVE